MNILLQSLEFFKSKTGKYCILSVVILLGGYLVQTTQEKRAEQSLNRPQPASHKQWGEQMESEANKQASFHKNMRPFRASPNEPPKNLVVIQAPEKTDKKIIAKTVDSEEAFTPLPSLIKGSRVVEKKPVPVRDNQAKRPQKPRLLLGGILAHCELIAPVLSGQAGSPVHARLTRSIIQKGRVIAPVGSLVIGEVKNSQDNRLYFAQEWHILSKENEHLEIQAHAQQKSYDAQKDRYGANDGMLGIEVKVSDQEAKTKARAIIGTFAEAATSLAKERVRTSFGEYVPSSTRNILLEGSESLLDQHLAKQKNDRESGSVRPLLAGEEFYLSIIISKANKSPFKETSSLDSKLQSLLDQRLKASVR